MSIRGRTAKRRPRPVPRRAARVDLVIDDPAVRTEIDASLARLEQFARDRGTALGLAGADAGGAVDRLAAWAALLDGRGLVLVPVSAVVGTGP